MTYKFNRVLAVFEVQRFMSYRVNRQTDRQTQLKTILSSLAYRGQ